MDYGIMHKALTALLEDMKNLGLQTHHCGVMVNGVPVAVISVSLEVRKEKLEEAYGPEHMTKAEEEAKAGMLGDLKVPDDVDAEMRALKPDTTKEDLDT